VRITRSLTAIIATILIAAAPLAASAQFSIGVGFTIGSAPPPLPVYSQPPVPYAGAVWTPGYWAWGPAGYYWVPGTWVAPPAVGLYWTPGYWGVGVGGGYGWNAGYWGATVGFYGGINYGFGYPGVGFYGGAWNNGVYGYNSAYTNINKTVTNNVNVYHKTINCTNCFNKNVSYNGGHGGITTKPTPVQVTARQNGVAPTTAQRQQATVAGEDRNQYANVNKGKPPVTGSQKPYTDPKQIPHNAPVTAADKQAAQSQVKTAGSANKAPANQAPANKAPANKAPVSQPKQPAAQPHHAAPPQQPAAQPAHNAPKSHPQSMQAHPPTGHPQGGHPPMGHPQSGGHPPASHPQGGGQKPPGGGGQKPPGGQGNQNKPPRR